MNTETLISRLSDSVTPVQRLRPVWARATLWFLIGFPSLAVIVAIHGLNAGPAEIFADRRLMIEEIATLATALSAAAAAFASTIPGSSRKWLWLPLVPFAVWLLAVGEGCLNDWQVHGWDGLSLHIDSGCFLPMALASIIPTIAMIRMLQAGAPLSPRISLLFGMLATAALVNFGLRLFHLGDATIIVLVWHFGILAVYCVGASLLAHRYLSWRHVAVQLQSPRNAT